MGNFKDDLIKWEAAEAIAMNILNDKLWLWLKKNVNNRWIDLVPNWWVECKLDEYSIYSWNFYIETSSNWKPSWIFKDEEYVLRYWCHSDGVRLFVIDWDDMKQFVSEKINLCKQNKSLTSKWFRYVESGWNWWRTQWLLVPVLELEKISKYVYNLK